MQRAFVPSIVDVHDDRLYAIKNFLENNFWGNKQEGLFQFQFYNEQGMPDSVRPTQGGWLFQIVRYTPDIYYNSFETSIQGMLNFDGTVSYGGGRTGKVNENNIHWFKNNWDLPVVWEKVSKMPLPKRNKLDITDIRAQAQLDSVFLFGAVYNDKYLNL